MKSPVTLVQLDRPVEGPARAPGALARSLPIRIFWRLVALAIVIALAQVAVHAIHSSRAPARSAAAPLAAGTAPASPSQGFRDDDSCDLVGEPVECR